MKRIILPSDTMSKWSKLEKKVTRDSVMDVFFTLNYVFYTSSRIYIHNDVITYRYKQYKLCLTNNYTLILKERRTYSFEFSIKLGGLILPPIEIDVHILREAIQKINILLGTDWFNKMDNYENYKYIPCHFFYRRVILQLIWTKKITNPKMLMETLSTLLGIQNITWKRVRNFLNSGAVILSWLPNIDKYVNNPNTFIDKLLLNADKYKHLTDYLNNISKLGIKSNIAKWSISRFELEREKIESAILEKEIKAKSEELIFSDDFNKFLPESINCHFINSEQKVFIEASLMRNCLYTNYCRSILMKNYFAISVDDNVYGRATVGIVATSNGCSLDQIKGPRNTAPKEGLEQIMLKWIAYNQHLLTEIHRQPYVE